MTSDQKNTAIRASLDRCSAASSFICAPNITASAEAVHRKGIKDCFKHLRS